ncbi:MAG: hypothetical protein Q9199_003628 [Rusavskia elegans]
MSSITSAEDVYEDASDNPHYLARIKLEVPSPKANVATVRDFIATYLVQQCDFQPAEAIQKASQFTMNGSQLFNQKLAVFEQVLPQNGKGIYMEVQSSYWGAQSSSTSSTGPSQTIKAKSSHQEFQVQRAQAPLLESATYASSSSKPYVDLNASLRARKCPKH